MSIRSSYPSIAPSLSLDFAKSRRLDPRITFTRAQTGNIATYVGADGLIKYAGPDEPRFDHRSTFRTNLIKYSETFTPNWSHQRIVLTNNSIISPDGLTNGSKIQGDGTTGGAMSVYQQYTNVQPSSSWTISVFAKAGDAKWLKIEAYDGINNPGAFFNLESGTIGTIGNNMSNPIIKSYGNGWWRCSVVRTIASNANQVRPQFTLAVGNDTISVIDTKYFYLWGAQLEAGDTLTDYIATGPSAVTKTNIESLGLLVEESRTNLVTNSEDVSNQDINGTHQLNYSLNTTSAPDGNNTADSILGTGISGRPTIQYRIALPASTQLCMSIFVKPINGFDQVSLETASYSNWADNGWVKFDLSKKEILENTVQGGGIIEYPDGWFRIYMISTTQSSTSNGGFYVNLMDSEGNWSNHVVPTNQGLYLWGGQIEAGAFPTSYIPTEGSTVTRSADDASITGNNFSDFYNQDEGTFVTLAQNNTAGFGAALLLFNGITDQNSIRLYANFDGAIGLYVTRGSAIVQANLGFNPGLRTKYKFVGAYKANDFAACLNGGEIVSDIIGLLPETGTITTVLIGRRLGNQLNAPISRITYYPKRLPNEQLQQLTL